MRAVTAPSEPSTGSRWGDGQAELRPSTSMAAEASEESRLVEQALGGDRSAFDRIVRARFGQIYGILFRLVGNHEDAEDLAQECFVRAYRSLRFYRGEGSLGGWLARIAVHLARDHGRRGGRSAEVVGLPPAFEPSASELDPGQELSHKELAHRLAESVERLPRPLRVALMLRVLEGMEYEEVAEATGMRPGTVRTQVMKARRLLMRWMGPWLERSVK